MMPSGKERPRMKSHVLLGLKIDVGAIKNIRIENFSLENDVKSLKQEASKRSNNPAESLELIYRGKVLDESKCLKDYGVRCGEMIHVFRKIQKPDKAVVESRTKFTAESINLLFRTYGLPTRSVTSFSNAMEIFCEASSIEKILELEPGMAQDPVALSYLTVPELVYHLQDAETFENIIKKHPLLIPTFVKVIKSQMQSTGRGGRHLMTDMHVDSEEDDDVDVGADDDGDDEDGEAGPLGGGLITPEQLSAALAMAGASAGTGAGSAGASTSASSQDTGFRDFLGSLLAADGPEQSGAASSRPLITSDMFSNALSQAISSVSTNPVTPGVTSAAAEIRQMFGDSAVSSSPDNPGTRANYATQLIKMQEMGLVDHRLNLRALIICSGDVSAAINLILSKAIED